MVCTEAQKKAQLKYENKRRKERPDIYLKKGYVDYCIKAGLITRQEAKPYDHHTLKTVIIPRKRLLKRIRESSEKLEALTLIS